MARLSPALTAVIIGSSTALVLGSMAAQAAPPTDPASPAGFARINVDTKLTGAAFSVAGDVFGSGKQDLVVTGFGAFTGSGQTSVPPAAGTVQIYRPGSSLNHWTKVPVVTESDAITFPNQPTLADVNGDGKTDVIVPGGYFFDSYVSNSRGSITWWENKGAGNPFVRHDVVTGSPFSYHGVQFADLDGDGIKDFVSTGEQGMAPPNATDDVIEMHYFKGRIASGTGERTFDPPVALATNGGSLPVVSDVDKDGKLDIVSAQYFGSSQPSFLWLKQIGSPTAGALTAANFQMREISSAQGLGFQIKLVPNLRGDGIDRWVGTNHLSHPMVAPAGGVFELTPTADLTKPWTAKTLAGPFAPRPNHGQAAPGVFGAGDLDGDGDIDLALSGDGDRRLFWIEQKGSGQFETHVLEDYDATTTSAPGMGQSGGAIIADLDGNGTNEMAFSSFDQNTVAVYVRHGGGVAAKGTLKVSAPATAAVGARTTLKVDLTGVTGTAARSAQVTFKAARTGVVKNVGAVRLAPSATAGRFSGSIVVASAESGTYSVTSGGSQAAATVTARSTIKGFSTSTKRLKKKMTIKNTVSVRPGFGRTVQLQKWTCSKSKPNCTWKTVSSRRLNGSNRATVAIKAPKGTSYWRVFAPATKAGSAAVTASRTIKR